MRSLLMVTDPSDLDAALTSGADAIAIAAGQSDEARSGARKGLERARKGGNGPLVYAAVHAPTSEALDLDLDAIMPAHPDGIVVEAHAGADVQHVSIKLAVREAKLGLEDGSTKIIAIAASTPASVFTLGSYRGASRRLAGLIFGGTTPALADGSEAAPAAVARSLVVLAAKSAGVLAIDSPGIHPGDSDGLRESCKAAFHDGFDAKCAVHPDQIAIINAVFDR